MIATLKNLRCVEIFSCWRWIDSLLSQVRTKLIAPDSLLKNAVVPRVWNIYFSQLLGAVAFSSSASVSAEAAVG